MARARRSVRAMHEEITIPELTEVVARLAALLGPREGSVRPARGRDHEPQLPRELRRHRLRRAAARASAPSCWGSTARPSASRTRPRPSSGSRPKVAAMFEEPSCLVTLFVDGREMTAEELREPETLAEVARDLRSVPRLAAPSCPPASTRSELVRGVRARRRASTAASRRTGTRRRSPPRARSSSAIDGQPSTRARARPQRPADRELPPGRRPDAADRLGVRRDGRPLVRPRQLRGQQRARRRPGEPCCWRPTSASRRTSDAARDAEAVPLHVGLPRGRCGASCRRACPSSTSTSASTRRSTSTACEKARKDPRFEGWIEEARGWWPRVGSSPAPRAA